MGRVRLTEYLWFSYGPPEGCIVYLWPVKGPYSSLYGL
jgi:hypothetical protein